MTLPSNNISVSLVKNTLETSATSIGALCTNSNINMWSKYKPVSIAGTPNDWYKGNDNNFGLSIPIWESGTNQTWTYSKPTGGSSSPYRLGDFRNYNHDAVFPLNIIDNNGKTFNLTENKIVVFPALITNDGTYQILLDDIAELDGYYFAVEVENKSGTKVWGATSGYALTLDFNTIPFVYSEWQSGTLILRFFLSSELKSFASGNLGHTRKAIHYSTEHPTTQTIKIVKESTISCEMTGIRRFLNSGTWISAESDFENPDEPSPGYYSPDSIAIKCRFKSQTSNSQYLSGSKLTFGVTRTHLTSDGYFVPFSSANVNNMYDLSGNRITSITAPSGNYGDEVILYSNSLMNRNSNGMVYGVESGLTTWTSILIREQSHPIALSFKKIIT